MENTKQNDQIAVGILKTYLDLVSMGSSISKKSNRRGTKFSIGENLSGPQERI